MGFPERAGYWIHFITVNSKNIQGTYYDRELGMNIAVIKDVTNIVYPKGSYKNSNNEIFYDGVSIGALELNP